jgi:hypothetical protein
MVASLCMLHYYILLATFPMVQECHDHMIASYYSNFHSIISNRPITTKLQTVLKTRASYILYDYVSLSYRTSVLYDRARLAIPISYCPMHCHIATVP